MAMLMVQGRSGTRVWLAGAYCRAEKLIDWRWVLQGSDLALASICCAAARWSPAACRHCPTPAAHCPPVPANATAGDMTPSAASANETDVATECQAQIDMRQAHRSARDRKRTTAILMSRED